MTQFGPVSGTVDGPCEFKNGAVSFTQGAAGANLIMKKDTNIWYVDSGQSVSGNGKTPKTAFITFAESIAAAGDYDTILIVGNTIETIAAAGIDITQEGLRIFGANGSQGRQAAALKCTGTAAMLRIGANRVEIAGLHLSQRGAYTCVEVGTATVGAVYGTWIHHCNLNGYGTGTYGVSGYAQTADTVNLCVEDNYFSSFATSSIHVNGTGDSYVRNVIKVSADTIGIDIKKTGGTRAEGVIMDNLLYGLSGSSTKAIYLAGNITAGNIIIARNLLSGTWNVTITAGTGDVGVENYEGTTTGGTVIDCNSSG